MVVATVLLQYYVANVMILAETSIIVAHVDIFKLYHIRTLNENVLHGA